MFNKIQPRLAMVTHLSYDEELIPEIVAGIRVHYSGLFQFGAPDIVVVNVTKDAVWTRKAAIPEAGNMARPSPRDAIGLFDLSPTNLEVRFPNPRHTVADMQEPAVRDREIDPKQYYPSDMYREPQRNFPNGFKIDVRQVVQTEAPRGAGQTHGRAGESPATHRQARGPVRRWITTSRCSWRF